MRDEKGGIINSCPWWQWFAVILFLLTLRLITLGDVALLDTTEGRYASIGLEMLRLSNWITPFIPLEGGWEPFWGKPPLQFWLIALSCELFGPSEFAARFPSFIAAVALGVISWIFTRRFFGERVARMSVVILASSCLLLHLSGAVLMDMTLAVGTWGSLVFAVMALESESPRIARRWGILAALLLSVGVLAKGPIAVVLPGFSFLAWMVWEQRGREALSFPWMTSIVVFLVCTVPWFLVAERATPGFLEYFFVNEHWLRFLTPEYGDRYGSGHIEPRGIVWLMAAGAIFPWTPFLLFLFPRLSQSGQGSRWYGTPGFRLAAVAALSPLIFFTFARQLTMTYVVPALPALAVVLAVIVERCDCKVEDRQKVIQWSLGINILSLVLSIGAGISVPFLASDAQISVFAILATLFLFFAVYWAFRNPSSLETSVIRSALFFSFGYFIVVLQLDDYVSERRSTRDIIEQVAEAHAGNPPPLTFVYGSPFSAYFYSEALFPHPVSVYRTEPEEILEEEAKVLLLKQPDIDRLPSEVQERYRVAGKVGRWVWMVPRGTQLTQVLR